MYLSALVLDRHSPAVRQCLANCHDMHRTVMSAFGPSLGDSPREKAGVLYRLDTASNKIKLFVLSKDKPEWDKAVKSGFIPSEGTPKQIDQILTGFKTNRTFSFDILAQPSKKIPQEGKHSARIPLCTSEAREEWLYRKARQNGFAIQWARQEGSVKYMLNQGQNGEKAAHQGVRFRGELTVMDQELFQKAFKNGIGAGKAYGFGMLMLFPASSG